MNSKFEDQGGKSFIYFDAVTFLNFTTFFGLYGLAAEYKVSCGFTSFFSEMDDGMMDNEVVQSAPNQTGLHETEKKMLIT